MFPSLPTSPATLRKKIRVKKRRVFPPGWTPVWRGIGYASAVVSGGMAGVAVVLLVKLLMTGEAGFSPSAWNPANVWPAMAQSLGFAPVAVPEPSRMMLTLFAFLATMLKRRR